VAVISRNWYVVEEDVGLEWSGTFRGCLSSLPSFVRSSDDDEGEVDGIRFERFEDQEAVKHAIT
jgi:hypothetical protein